MDVCAESDGAVASQGRRGLLFLRVLEEKLIELNLGLITAENVEEVVLRKKFGAEYESYCSKAWKILPDIW